MVGSWLVLLVVTCCVAGFRSPHAALLRHKSLFARGVSDLNEEQVVAVTAPVQHICVHAGPGSGKTRVLVHRIAYLLQEEDISPREILAVTFTRKAATEMKERIGELVGQDSLKRLTVCTLHSFCCMVLRMSHSAAHKDDDRDDSDQGDLDDEVLLNNLDGSFSIYDSDDTKKIIKNLVLAEGGDLEEWSPGQILECISVIKREGLVHLVQEPSKLQATARARDLGHLDPDLLIVSARLLPSYQSYLRYVNARDFDDLILDALELIQASRRVSARVKSRFKHILVDEWQDVDKVQYALLTRLVDTDPAHKSVSLRGRMQADKSLFVVGDPHQTIYSWRGADALNMENFQRDHPSCLTFYLVRNYRSAKTIVAASQGILAGAEDGVGGKAFPVVCDESVPKDESDADAVQVVNTFKDETQAEYVAKLVQYLQRTQPVPGTLTTEPPTVAILYRRHNLSPAIEQALILRGVRYALWGGPGLLGRKSVKDLLSYVRLLVNPRDMEALRRTINFPPRGVGSSTQDAFFDLANRLSADRSALKLLVELGEGKYKPSAKSKGQEDEKSTGKDRKKGEPDGPSAKEPELDLTPRQMKALRTAGAVFAKLQALIQDWSGSMDKLLEDIIEVSGLKTRAEQVLQAEDDERVAQARLKGSSRKSSSPQPEQQQKGAGGTNFELLQVLQLAREFEKDGSLSLETTLMEMQSEAEAQAGEGAGTGIESLSASSSLPADRRIQLFLDMLQLHATELDDAWADHADHPEAHAVEKTVNKVKLMTLHAAKGLEFDYVMIIGLEESCLPSSFRKRGEGGGDDADEALQLENFKGIDVAAGDDKQQGEDVALKNFVDEERRLLYVGMTRAKKKLVLLYRSRKSLGNGGSMPLRPSRFLKDIPMDVPFVKWK